MARPRKPKNYTEQLQQIDSQITSLKEEIQSLKARRKEVAASKEKAEMQQLMELVKISGKSPAEFIDALHSNPEEDKEL